MSQRTVTPWRSTRAAIPSGERIPGGVTTSRAPLASIPQISAVEASKENGASSSPTWRGPKARQPATRRTTPRCGTATPLGAPVEPEVYIT